MLCCRVDKHDKHDVHWFKFAKYKISLPELFRKKILEILQNSQRNTCDQSHFFNTVAVFRQRCFPVNLSKFLRTTPVVAYENIILIDLQSKAEIF